MAILTTSPGVDEHAFSSLSRWTYVHLGTAPFGPIEAAAADAARRREETEAAHRNAAWTSREFRLIVGRLVKREFLDGVDAICGSTGVRWEWRIERKRLALTIVVVIAGPGYAVDDAAGQITRWQARFGIVSGS